VFVNRVLRIMFGPNWYDLNRRWIKLHNKELLQEKLGSARHGGVRWSGHGSQKGGRWNKKGRTYRFLRESPKERDNYEYQDVDQWIILKWIMEK
jgi:hypothetical protein